MTSLTLADLTPGYFPRTVSRTPAKRFLPTSPEIFQRCLPGIAECILSE
ncbi:MULTISPECIES: hypothetical protein [unclassified Streptomyces]